MDRWNINWHIVSYHAVEEGPGQLGYRLSVSYPAIDSILWADYIAHVSAVQLMHVISKY